MLARKMLKMIISLHYLARQGLALTKAVDAESNLIQLLQLRGENDHQILLWLARSQRKYVSHENQMRF